MLGGQTIHDYVTGIVKQVLREQKNHHAEAVVLVDGLTTASASAEFMQQILSQQDLSATVTGMTVTGTLGAVMINVQHISGLVDITPSALATPSIPSHT